MRLLLISLLLAAASLHAAPQSIATGKGARVEQTLNSGVVRFGSNTHGQVNEDGSLQLDQGLALISSDSGLLRRSSIEVTTAAGSITVRGTALIALLPDGSLKITCLEGKVKSSIADQKQTLEPGHLLWLPKNGKVGLAEVELGSLTQSCALLGEGFKPLARSGTIASLSLRQAKALEKAAASQMHTQQIAADQPGVQGASNLVALSNAMASSQGAAPGSYSDITYSSSSASIGSGATMISSGTFGAVTSISPLNPTQTGSLVIHSSQITTVGSGSYVGTLPSLGSGGSSSIPTSGSISTAGSSLIISSSPAYLPSGSSLQSATINRQGSSPFTLPSGN